MIFWEAVADELHGHGFKTRNEVKAQASPARQPVSHLVRVGGHVL